jgi:hypothetical protein
MSLESRRRLSTRRGLRFGGTTRETVPMLIANRPLKGCDQLRTKGLGG